MEEGARVGTKEKEKTKVKINGSNQEQGIGQHAFEISGTNKIQGNIAKSNPCFCAIKHGQCESEHVD